jgi:cyclic dehypoxanthinyl futalosine synthase
MNIDDIYKKIEKRERINKEEGIFLLKNGDPIIMGNLAHNIRMKKNNPHIVTFIMDTNINYTNICYTKCSFCAFYKDKEHGYTLSIDELREKVIQAKKNGIDTVLLQGGLNKNLPYSYYLNMIETLTSINGIHIHAFSPPEIELMGKISGKSIKEVLIDLKNKGLKTIPGGGAEILSEEIRKTISPHKTSTKRWLEISKEAHLLGFKTTATMMFGHIEKEEDIVEHLNNLRNLQDETEGFTAFIMWDFKLGSTPLSKEVKHPATAYEYLKILSFSRIYLDNFSHIQASSSQGNDVRQMALFFGADDFGSMLLEENVMKSAGFVEHSTIAEISHIIKDADLKPALRTTDYKILRFI